MFDSGLENIKSRMLEITSSDEVRRYVNSMCREKDRPVGKFNPWAWWIEIVRGCNLSCWHCPTRLFPKDTFNYMDEKTWISLLKVINQTTPYGRLEFGNAGEPTLHPNFLEYLKMARKECPNVQILTYTNGTTLTSKTLTYKQIFDAGLNMIFVDMYSPYETHKKLAEESGFYWFHQDNKPENAPNIFKNYKKPDMHIIMLAENPSNWSKRKSARGAFSKFFNDLDWESARVHGIEPLEKKDVPSRRCDLPSKFVNVNYDGTFTFCCFDFMRHLAGKLGNINDGLDGFFEYWVGEYMQTTRKKLYNKDRSSHELCSLCDFTSIRCDIPHWKNEEIFDEYWKDGKWHELV